MIRERGYSNTYCRISPDIQPILLFKINIKINWLIITKTNCLQVGNTPFLNCAIFYDQQFINTPII